MKSGDALVEAIRSEWNSHLQHVVGFIKSGCPDWKSTSTLATWPSKDLVKELVSNKSFAELAPAGNVLKEAGTNWLNRLCCAGRHRGPPGAIDRAGAFGAYGSVGFQRSLSRSS